MWQLQEYIHYITSNAPTNFSYTQEKDQFTFNSPKAIGTIHFYEQNIIELSIIDTNKQENAFYLHFQLQDENHAKELTDDFFKTFITVSNKKRTHVLLTCSSALTTSFFAEQLNNACAVLKEDMQFDAVSFNKFFEIASNYDVLLLAPQVSYNLKKVQEVFPNKIVLKIPSAMFAGYKTGEVISLIKQSNKEIRSIPQEESSKVLKQNVENKYRILVICLINREGSNRIAYRIYDHGEKTLDKEVIRPTLFPSDIDDLLTYIFARHTNIDCMGISLPGITEKGRVNNPYMQTGFHNLDLASKITNQYQIPVFILNDTNALVLGYHIFHEEYKDIVFCFYPEGKIPAGAGTVINNQLHTGLHHNAGEVYPLLNYIDSTFSTERNSSPELALKEVIITILAFSSTIAPQQIVIYNPLIPNEKELYQALSKHLENNYIPHIRLVNRIKKYMMPGLMQYCLLQIKKNDEYVRSYLRHTN